MYIIFLEKNDFQHKNPEFNASTSAFAG